MNSEQIVNISKFNNLLKSNYINSSIFLQITLQLKQHSCSSIIFSFYPKSSIDMGEPTSHIKIQQPQTFQKSTLIRWQSGAIYLGQCNGLVMEGTGKLVFQNGDYYEGQFKCNNFHGFGRYTGYNGVYIGQWLHGLKSGKGRQQDNHGSKFTGRYQNGLKQGIGLFEWPDGSYYYGMFKQDRIQGPGKMIKADGSKIEGEWKDNEIQGQGRQTDKAGNIYKGSFKNGIKNGYGILIEKQEIIEGIWTIGKGKGAAIISRKDGVAYCGKYEKEELIRISDEEYQELRDKTCKQIEFN